jgi:molybdopterin synthase sulfur carrier subunit
MALVWIPVLMRDLTGGLEQIEVPGQTVRQIVDNLEAIHPGMRARLVEDDQVTPRVAVVVDGQMSRLRMNQAVKDDSQVRFVPIIHGG